MSQKNIRLAARRKYFFAFCGIKQYPIILIGKKKYRYAFEKYEVSSVYLIAGAYDFTVILQGKTLKEVSRFVSEKLATLDSVIGTATYFVLKKYKDHGVVFSSKKQDERLAIIP